MAFDLDGYAVLAGMAAHPDAFAGVEAEAAKLARALLTKLLKDKTVALSRLRAMAAALPPGTLAHVTDAMTDAEVSSLAARLDKLNPTLKGADRLAKATLVADLIASRAEPVTSKGGRSEKAPVGHVPRKAPSSGVEAARKVLHSRAMGARKSTTKAAGA